MPTKRSYFAKRGEKKAKTILRAPGLLKPLIVKEMYRRGGRVHVGRSDKPGPDRDLYVIVAKALGVTDNERQLCVGDLYPDIMHSGRLEAERDAERNVWDYNMLVAVEHMKIKSRGTPWVVRGTPKGVWELTAAGRDYARRLLSQENA
jgi:hypothetical protein